MTIVEMLGQSTVLTLLGLGVVFGFLVIMIVSITLVGKGIHALGIDKDVLQPRTAGNPSGTGNNAALTAAISAAVSEYQKSNKQ